MKSEGGDVKDFVEYIAKQLVDQPEQVIVREESQDDGKVLVTLTVARPDIGRIVGKRGRTAFALRILTSAIGRKTGRKVVLEVVG
jgi:uncharacterized protein